MGDKKTDHAKIRKVELEIGSENRLKSPTDSPKIGNFHPSLASPEQRNDDCDHRPIAELKRQRLFPIEHFMFPEVSREAEVIDQQKDAQADTYRSINPMRTDPADGQPQPNREGNDEQNNEKVRRTENLEDRSRIHFANARKFSNRPPLRSRLVSHSGR